MVQLLSHVRLFLTTLTAARQASLSFTVSLSLLKLMSIELVIRSNHLILCRPLLLLPSIHPSIRVFSSESALHIRWPKYCSFSFSISPSNEHSGLSECRRTARTTRCGARLSWMKPCHPLLLAGGLVCYPASPCLDTQLLDQQ